MAVGQSRGRYFCLRGLNPLPSLVLLEGEDQPIGPGWESTFLLLYAFPPAPLIWSPGKQPQSAGNGTEPPGMPVVSNSLQSPRVASWVPPQETGSPRGGANLALEPRPAAVMTLASEGPEPLLKACDQTVVQTNLNSRAPSTRSLYGC